VGNQADLDLWEARYYSNAQGFTGEPTYGLINVNTAPLEVLRALPGMFRIVYREVNGSQPLALKGFPRVGVPEGVIQFRERHDGEYTGFINGPKYVARYDPPNANLTAEDVSPMRGLASPHEVLSVNEPAEFDALLPPHPAAGYGGQREPTTGTSGPPLYNDAWRIEGAALLHQIPNAQGNIGVIGEALAPTHQPLSTWSSTDRQSPIDGQTQLEVPDPVAGDAEEANLLYAGISNLITSRSDVFTVYFKVRTFRRDPETGVWNALDRENIIDDSRYVMLVDRSRVEHPMDEPKILYLEKLPR
jgi:hypothetical protein